MSEVEGKDVDWLQWFFPKGAPQLWCPLLTPFDQQGRPDVTRLRAHLRYLAPYVKGLLIPGSTGEGWDMPDEMISELLEAVLPVAQEENLWVLVGVLKKDPGSVRLSLERCAERLGFPDDRDRRKEVMRRMRVCGFAVCPPAGRERSQGEISDGLTTLLEMGWPTALYQLPQVTENEMSVSVLAELADRFGNFYLFKDTSGNDAFALSGKAPGRLFLARGAEGNYHRWSRLSDGPYHGFLLSAANTFSRELSDILNRLKQGDRAGAEHLSNRITAVMEEVFGIVRQLPFSNPFTNANKALNHFCAFGPEGIHARPPRVYSGEEIPFEVLRATGVALNRFGLMPVRGYLD